MKMKLAFLFLIFVSSNAYCAEDSNFRNSFLNQGSKNQKKNEKKRKIQQAANWKRDLQLKIIYDYVQRTELPFPIKSSDLLLLSAQTNLPKQDIESIVIAFCMTELENSDSDSEQAPSNSETKFEAEIVDPVNVNDELLFEENEFTFGLDCDISYF